MRWRAATLTLAMASVAPGARASDPPDTEPHEYSSYEQEAIADAVVHLGASREPSPAGKRIEDIRIVTLEVIEERDPYPRFFNAFHVTSRPYVIERELLFRRGQLYDHRRIDESARNLRNLRQLSVVLIVPLRGSSPDSVVLLVITKDVWSLRMNTDIAAVDGRVTRLLLQPAEENWLGTHTLVGALFVLLPATYSFGGQFINRRVAGSRIASSVSANVIFNRDTGDTEGSFGSFSYGQPLYSAESRWAWRAAVAWQDLIFRSFIGPDLRTFDAAATPQDDAIDYVYDYARYYGVSLLTRSTGRRHKLDFSAGVELDHRKARPRGLARVEPIAAQEFIRQELPVSDTRVGPMVQVRAYTSDYRKVLDFETLGLQEDYRLGHELAVRVYPASEHVASSRTLLGLFAGAGYTAPFGDGLARAMVSSTHELADDARSDALFQANTRVVTPRLGFGRVVHDTQLLHRYENYLNERFTLGGSGRLRGYPPDAFIGRDMVSSNLEYRSAPVSLLSTLFGGAVFYDVGDVFDGASDLRLKQSVGLGLRVLFPQANRIVMRLDYGVPVTARGLEWPGSLFLAFGQAFGMPTLEPPTLAADFAE
ncbi:MAG: BamA/TamA family outer membrane protein [Polyangiaceae bacterium]|nr:BamA/TamA family outer membrane protein [Polyangiaceae bacterium]